VIVEQCLDVVACPAPVMRPRQGTARRSPPKNRGRIPGPSSQRARWGRRHRPWPAMPRASHSRAHGYPAIRPPARCPQGSSVATVHSRRESGTRPLPATRREVDPAGPARSPDQQPRRPTPSRLCPSPGSPGAQRPCLSSPCDLASARLRLRSRYLRCGSRLRYRLRRRRWLGWLGWLRRRSWLGRPLRGARLTRIRRLAWVRARTCWNHLLRRIERVRRFLQASRYLQQLRVVRLQPSGLSRQRAGVLIELGLGQSGGGDCESVILAVFQRR